MAFLRHNAPPVPVGPPSPFPNVGGPPLGGPTVASIGEGVDFEHRDPTIQYGPNVTVDGTELGERRGQILMATVCCSPEERIFRAARYFATSVEGLLDQIKSHRVGKAVIREIHRCRRTLRIVPYFGGSKDSPNAVAKPDKAVDARRRHWINRDTHGNLIYGSLRGTGIGSDAVVKFLPSDFVKHVPGADTPAGPTAVQDEVLLHELVHAVRYMKGLSARRKVRFQRSFAYHNMEEFFAILIANIYRSECGRPGLRHDHAGFDTVSMNSVSFLKIGRNRAHVRQLRREMPNLFRELRGVRADFNPTQFIA